MAKQVLPTYSICSITNNPSSANNFVADRFAAYLKQHTDLHFPHKHSFYHLVYFTKGSGSHSIDFVHFPVEKGQVYCMVPGQVHSWQFNGETDGYIINFSAQYLQSFLADHRYIEQFSFFSGIANEQVIQLPAEAQKEAENILTALLSETVADKAFKDDLIRLSMIQFFIHVHRNSTSKGVNNVNPYNSLLLQNFKKLVDSCYKEKKLTKEYAAMLYVTPNHLNALCKDVTGQAAGEIIRNRVLLEAKRMLTNANVTIAEISAELNFNDNSYFTKFFKKYTSLTPEEFRKQFENKK